MNTLEPVSWCISVCIPVEYKPKSGISGSWGCIYSNLEDNGKLLSKWLYYFTLSPEICKIYHCSLHLFKRQTLAFIPYLPRGRTSSHIWLAFLLSHTLYLDCLAYWTSHFPATFSFSTYTLPLRIENTSELYQKLVQQSS
jgi:hypothetical protein